MIRARVFRAPRKFTRAPPRPPDDDSLLGGRRVRTRDYRRVIATATYKKRHLAEEEKQKMHHRPIAFLLCFARPHQPSPFIETFLPFFITRYIAAAPLLLALRISPPPAKVRLLPAPIPFPPSRPPARFLGPASPLPLAAPESDPPRRGRALESGFGPNPSSPVAAGGEEEEEESDLTSPAPRMGARAEAAGS
ncbi:hypothetical protein NL676_010604 [Syzygium grande]|nr:hypothetical protein NL676_010604 [Syzygium grande]